MGKRRRVIYILFLLVGLLVVVAYVVFAHWPSQAKERPTLTYFYAGG
jgi:ABC-type transporter Mla subunit MlaD